MAVLESQCETTFPPKIAEAVKVAVDKTMTAICGEKPTPQENSHSAGTCPCVAGIISFLGDVNWSLSWALTDETAPALIQKFVGFEIPFDSPDMGDAVGELINVLAGDVVAQLDQRRIKAQMSLPTVARGHPLEFMPERSNQVVHLEYTSPQGRFWLRLMSAARSVPLRERMPGT